MPIGKETAKRRDGKSSFHALAEYIIDAEKTKGETWTLNCLSIDTSAVEMTATSMQNSRCENPVYHAIISWPSDEKPTAEEAKEAGLIALKSLGFDTSIGGHQAIIALHRDTDNWHVHIAANKVHPQSLKSLHIEWSHKNLDFACRTTEIKQGWSEQNGLKKTVIDVDGNKQIVDSDYRNERNKGINKKTLDMEKHAGVYSFERYTKEIVGPLLNEELKKEGVTWQKIHKLLDESNVKIIQKGGGFGFADMPLFKSDFTEEQKQVEVERAGKTHAKASTAGSFARGANLIKKLGEFEPSSATRKLPNFRYNAKADSGREAVKAVQQLIPELTQEAKDEARLKAIFDQAMLDRKIVFQNKKETRKSEITDTSEIEQRELQDSLNKSRISTHAANAQLPAGTKLPTPTVNAILRVEREKKKAELKARQTAREKAFNAEFDAQEAKLQKHNSFHRWLEEQSKKEGELGDLAKFFYHKSKMKEQLEKEKRIDKGTEILSAPVEKRHIVFLLVISDDLKKQGYKAFNNGTHIAYVKDRKTKFRDYGNTINISTTEDQTIRDALQLSKSKWGNTIKIWGTAEFQAKAARIAFEIGLEDLQSDDKQAIEIFQALKQGRPVQDLAKQQADAITALKAMPTGGTPSPATAKDQYLDFGDRDTWSKLNKGANLLKIAESYGYSIEKQNGGAVRLIKSDQVLNINIDVDSDTFFMKNATATGADISGTAQDFIRREENISYVSAAEKLFILNRKFPKNIEIETNKEYDIAYVRHLFASATNDANNMKILNNSGLFKNDLGADTRVNDKGETFFAHRNSTNNIVGFEIKNKEDQGIWFVKGGQKGIYMANDIQDSKVERIVMTMDALEAEALKKIETKQNPQLLEKTLYLSLGGAASHRQIEVLKRYKNARMELHISSENGFEMEIDKLKRNFRTPSGIDVIRSTDKPTTRSAALYKISEQAPPEQSRGHVRH